MELVSLILIGLVVILAYFAVTSRTARLSNQQEISKTEIPGPQPEDKRQGNFPDIIQAGSLYHFLCDAHRKYGDVIQIWFGEKPVISTASPQSFTDQMRLFDKPAMSFIEPVFGNRGIQFVNGGEAKQRRRGYDAFLNQESVNDYFSTFKEVADEYIQKLSRLPVNSSVNVYDVMFDLSCKAVGITLFGEYFKDVNNVQSFKELYSDFWPVLENNFTNGLPVEGTEERQYFDEVVNKVHNVARALIASRKHRTDRKFIDVVMETGHDEITVLGDILVYLVGGFHSTSITLTWCVYHASKYPDVFSRVQDELMRVLEHSDVTPSALHEMRYLRCFINETLRLRFVAPIATRKAGENTTIGGYVLPPGIDIIQALGVVMTSDVQWDRPYQFNPDRFLVKRHEQVSTCQRRSPLAFCPFGFAGRRKCPGQKFFYEESMVFLSTLFHHFEFRLNTDYDVTITYGLLTRPENDIYAKIQRRFTTPAN